MTRRTRSDEEHQHQVVLAQWLDAHQIRWIHPANEGVRSPATAARLRSEGMKKGASDCLIWTPSREGLATCLELKAPGVIGRRGRPTKDQIEFLEWAARDAHTQVCWGVDDAIDWLQSLGYGCR